MNSNIFRLVFSKKLGMLVPVAECSASQGKAGAGKGVVGQGAASPAGPPSAEFLASKAAFSKQRLAASLALMVTFWGATWGSVGWAQVLPQGGQVNSGQGSVSTNGNHMTVNQSTQVLGMTWQSFNIGAGNTVQFVQPNAQSVAINQVQGNSRSEIFGNLQANGQVFLLNPNGIIFGATAQVDVGALVASTATSINRDASGQWVLGQQGAGSIINQGHIRAQDGGFVVLAGAQVRNDGTIQANGGGVALAAGETVSIDISQGRQLKVKVDGAVLQALVDNQGVILADGGAVYLTASGRETLLQTVVNNGGIIQARSLVEREGRVLLLGAGGDTVSTGSIDVSGQQAGSKGGAVVIGGNRVALAGNAIVDASGVAGGGRVIIGGDLLGKATDLASIGLSDYAVVGSNAEIKIGSAQGDGGFVETSGKSLTMMGRVDGQSAGKNGEWLIDPTDITISTAASTATNTSNVWDSSNAAAIVNNASIEAALNSGTNVCVTTAGSGGGAGDITVSANIVKSAGADANLTLRADRTLNIFSRTIAATTGKLNVNLVAADTVKVGRVILSNSNITTNNGSLSVMVLNSTGGPIGGNSRDTSAVVSVNNTTLNVGSGGGGITLSVNQTAALAIGTNVDGTVGVYLGGNSNVQAEGGQFNVNVTHVGSTVSKAVDFNALTVAGNLSVNASANASTASGYGPGLVAFTGNVTSTSGKLDINATNSGSGQAFTSTGTVSTAGLGSVFVRGTSAGNGLQSAPWNAPVFDTRNGGDIELVGVSTGTGYGSLLFWGGGTVHTGSNGSFRMSGTTASGAVGVHANNAIVNQSGNANVTFTGKGGITIWGIGVSLQNLRLSQSGSGTFLASSEAGTLSNGVRIEGANTTINQSGSGTVQINGNTVSGTAVEIIAGALNMSGIGSHFIVNGTSTGTGTGVRLSNLNSTQSAGTVFNLTGVSDSGQGLVASSGSLVQNDNATAVISGISAQGSGAQLSGFNVTQNGSGTVNISGQANTSGTGLGTSGGLIFQNGTGSINLAGNSVTGTGLDTSGGVLRQAAAGTILVTGTSTTGDGINMSGTTRLGTSQSNSTWTATDGAGAVTSGTVNTTVTTTVNSTFTDLVDVVTDTVTNGTSNVTYSNGTTDGSLRINQSVAGGSITINGSSLSGGGTVISSAFINQSAAAGLNISGSSATGAGLAIGTGAVGNASSTSLTNITRANGTNSDTTAASNTTTVASGSNVVATTTGNRNVTTNTSGNVSTNNTVTTTVTTYQAPRMVFNSSVVNATTTLTGRSNGTAGVLVQGDALFNMAQGSQVVLNGTTRAAASGPGVLISGRTVSSSSISSSTSNVTGIDTTVSTSSNSGNLTIPVNLQVTGASTGAVVINGTSSGSGPGVYIGSESTLNASGTGALNVTGVSVSGQGVQLGGASLTQVTNRSTNGSTTGNLSYSNGTLVAVPGNSTTNSTSTSVLGSLTFNVSLVGQVNLVGNTTSGSNGVQIGGDPGAGVLYLTANTSVNSTRTDVFLREDGNYGNGMRSQVTNTAIVDTNNYSMARGAATGNLSVAGPVNISAGGNLSVAAGASLNVTGNASLSSTNTVQLAGNTTTSGNVNVTAVNNVTAPGNISSSGNLAIASTTGSVNTSGSTLNSTGNVAIAATNGSATLGSVTATNLNATASGNVTAVGTVNTTNTTSLNSTSGSVNVTGNVTAGNLTTAAAGNVSASGNVKVAGNTSLTSTTGNVSLTGNSTLNGTTTVAATNGSATLNTSGNLTLGNVTAGNLTATSTGTLTTAGAINTTSTTSLNSTAGSVNVVGTVTAGNLTAAAVGNITATGNLAVANTSSLSSATGDVSLTGNNTLNGTTTVNAPNGSAVVTGAANVIVPPNILATLVAQRALDVGGLSRFSGAAESRESGAPGVMLTALDDMTRDPRLQVVTRGINLPAASVIGVSMNEDTPPKAVQ